MTRKKPTSRFKGTSLFDKRIVITIPRTGVVILAGGIVAAVAIPVVQARVITALSLILAMVALATIAEARFEIRNFRYEIQEKIAASLEHWEIPEDMPDLRESVEAAFEGVPDNAKTRFLRLPKQNGRGTN